VGSAPIRGAACADSIVVVANSLLDFVMALVRDPDAAARYAADPAGAIADAHLDVSSADVNNLIPVVAESLSASAPTVGGGFGPVHGGDVSYDGDTNVWASGAATAAFDAFGAFDDPGTTHQPVIHDPIGDPAAVDAGTPSADTVEPASLHVPVIDEAPVIDAATVDGAPDVHTWDALDGHATPLEHHDPGAALDVFDA
jgi:hypothetical protein